MRYSQPFGTPQPPLGQYPRFVNGDPVRGIEGSIPPATAFDETQVEIVTVITNAGLTPTHDDLTQLWQALMILFAQKYISTDVHKYCHGVNADFPDLITALQWAGNYIILPSGHLTLHVNAGRWQYTSTIEVNHANANRISFMGAGTIPQILPSSMSITGFNTDTDAQAQLAALRNVYSSELLFQGGVTGFRLLRPGAAFHYLLITGTYTSAAPTPDGFAGGIGIDAFESFFVDGMALHHWGWACIQTTGCSLISYTSLSLVCGYAGYCAIVARSSYISFPQTMHSIFTSSAIGGVLLYATQMYPGMIYVAGNASPNSNLAGVMVEAGSQLNAWPGSQVYYNKNFGVTVADGSSFLFAQCTISQPANPACYYALWVDKGFATLDGGNVQNGISDASHGAIYGMNGANIEAIGTTIGGNAWPTPDTYGQQFNSFLRTH